MRLSYLSIILPAAGAGAALTPRRIPGNNNMTYCMETSGDYSFQANSVDLKLLKYIRKDSLSLS